MKKIGKLKWNIFPLVSMFLMLYACEYKDIADSDYPPQKVYLTTASYGVYNVNTPTSSENGAHRFRIDASNGRFIIPLSVSRGGMNKSGSINVNISVQNDTIPKMIANNLLNYVDNDGNVRQIQTLSADKYELPSKVVIDSGADIGKFELKIDLKFLKENSNKLFAVALYIDSSDREVAKDRGVGIIVIDTKVLE